MMSVQLMGDLCRSLHILLVYIVWVKTNIQFIVSLSHSTSCTHLNDNRCSISFIPSLTVFSGVRVAHSVCFFVLFCRSLFVLLSFFFWPFDLLRFTASKYILCYLASVIKFFAEVFCTNRNSTYSVDDPQNI
jgi:hypothetical protein